VPTSGYELNMASYSSIQNPKSKIQNLVAALPRSVVSCSIMLLTSSFSAFLYALCAFAVMALPRTLSLLIAYFNESLLPIYQWADSRAPLHGNSEERFHSPAHPPKSIRAGVLPK
jgi:hypothetical protein